MEILIILLSLLVGGCAAPNGVNSFGTENITFTLPTWQSDVYPSLDCWEIVVSNGKSFTIPPEENSFNLAIPKNRITSVTARPVTKNSIGEKTMFFYPAGTVYPNLSLCSGKTIENTLTWEDGFTAKVIELIYEAGKKDGYSQNQVSEFVSYFNWKKFSETIFAKETESEPFYNPWQVDLNTLIQKLLAKNFTVNNLKRKNIIALPLNLICEEENQPFDEKNIISPYIPENYHIAKTRAISVSTESANYFLYNTDYALLITASVNSKGEKKGSTEVVFLPIIV